MASENIKLRKRNFTASDGYFYMMDEEQDGLLQKTDDGNTAFTYPLDTLLSNPVVSLEYDGVYFWSMENVAENDVIIRRWKIDNYICKLQQTIDLNETGNHKYESQAFSVEHYHTALSSTVSGGSSILYLDDALLLSTASGSADIFYPTGFEVVTTDSGINYTCVLKDDDDSYKMWYRGEAVDTGLPDLSITYCQSTDGVNWSNFQPSIPEGSEGTYDLDDVHPDTVIKDGLTYKMWYTGEVYDGSYTGKVYGGSLRIIYCTSVDGIVWSDFQVVIFDGPNIKEDTSVSDASVIKDGSIYKMWFTRYGSEHPEIRYGSDTQHDTQHPEIRYCTSVDGINWSAPIEVIRYYTTDRSPTIDYYGSFSPCVIKDTNGVYKMWYIGDGCETFHPYGILSVTGRKRSIVYTVSYDGLYWFDYSILIECGSEGTYDINDIKQPYVIKDGPTDFKLWYTGTSAPWNRLIYVSGNVREPTLHLGPNSSGDTELVAVETTLSGSIILKNPTVYDYEAGDEVNYFTHIWLFNDFDGVSSDTGALYKFDGWSGHYIKRYSGAAYKNIKAATFYKVDVFNDYPNVDALCYIKGTNTLFVNINEYEDGSLRYYGSMVMENIKLDEATVIDVYDMTIDRDNMYRLQLIPDGTNTTWSLYSYLLSPLDSFVTSISLSASPAIIAANGLSTSDILAVVKDQFMEPIIGRNITFSENGDGSLTGGTLKVTDSNGIAQTEYKAGTTAQEVKITAVVEQTN